MFLTQLILNPWSRSVAEDLNDPYKLHQRVMKGFPSPLPDGERVLFRLELHRNPPQAVLLVQSHTSPDWQSLEQMDYLELPARTKSFSPTFVNGQVFQFRLAANPTKRLSAKNEKAGDRVGLFREDDQLSWVKRKALLSGFQVLDVQTTKIVQPDGWKNEKEKTHRIRQLGVRFDGRLAVIDADQLLEALSYGIGSGKSMGFGLLSLARV